MKCEKLLFLIVVIGVSYVDIQAAAQQQQKTVQQQRVAPIPLPLALERAANDSLKSCKSTASDPTSEFPEPFFTSVGSEVDGLDSAQYGCSMQNMEAEQIIKTAESASPAAGSDSSNASAGSLHSVHLSGRTSDRSDQEHLGAHVENNGLGSNNLGSPLLLPNSNSQMAENSAVPNPNLWRQRWSTLGKPALFYLVLTLLGVLHGGVNKHLSDGAVNKHFYETSWREWETGAVANTLTGLVLAVGCRLFHPLDPMSPFVRTWLGYPAALVAPLLGQMCGEVVPLPESAEWRNMAVNMWLIPLAFWYAGNGVLRLCARNATRTHSRINSTDTIDTNRFNVDSHEL